MLQVNTSGEEAKGGFIEFEDILNAAKYIENDCKFIKLHGLMTIGSAENSKKAAEEDIPNPDFTKLVGIRGKLSKELKIDEDSLELSIKVQQQFESDRKFSEQEIMQNENSR